MNNEILELIEPYTEKTLSEGCLFKSFRDNEILKIEDYSGFYINEEYLMPEEKSEGHERDDNVVQKILGHYDITAVLKYIRNNIHNGHHITEFDSNHIFIEKIEKLCKCDCIEITNNIGQLPNKPLHLYTEQEEKDLLELLNKLNEQ